MYRRSNKKYDTERSKVSKMKKKILNDICCIKRSFYNDNVKTEMYKDLLLIDNIYRLGFRDYILKEIEELKNSIKED